MTIKTVLTDRRDTELRAAHYANMAASAARRRFPYALRVVLAEPSDPGLRHLVHFARAPQETSEVAAAERGNATNEPMAPPGASTVRVGAGGDPSDVHPVFHGAFDWHSAVHAHWTMAALHNRYPNQRWAVAIAEELRSRLTHRGLEDEMRLLRARPGFERPYGRAWWVLAALELRELVDSQLASALTGWAAETLTGLCEYFAALAYPDRSGQHTQTAFAMGLLFDALAPLAKSSASHATAAERLLVEHAARLFASDRDAPIHLEPSGHDFLSPALASAWLIGRAASTEHADEAGIPTLATFLDRWLPQLVATQREPEPNRVEEIEAWLTPPRVTDRHDGKMAHLDGLALSRAWMLYELGQRSKTERLSNAAAIHFAAGVEPVLARQPTWATSHWLATFAAYAELLMEANAG